MFLCGNISQKLYGFNLCVIENNFIQGWDICFALAVKVT